MALSSAEKSRLWYANNRDKAHQKSRRWREKNPEKHREAVRKSREKRIEREGLATVRATNAANQRQLRAADPDRFRRYERELRLKNRAADLVNKARGRAKARGLSFTLSSEDISPLPSHCPVFGFELDYELSRASFNSPTLDRVDNDKGYELGNVIVVSRKANTMKSDGTVEDMKLLYEFYEKIKS
jgi:hypothetical protein